MLAKSHPQLLKPFLTFVFLFTAIFSVQVIADNGVLQESQSISMDETVAEANANGFIDINTADAKQLSTLANIGLKKAQEIIAFRKANGLFSSIEELEKVKGIGKRTVEKNRHRLQVANN